MEAELIELYEAAKKSADLAAGDGVEESSPEEDRCVDALKQLKKFPVNYQLLVSTQVGKQLRHLTKHPRKRIQTLASNLIGVWKNIIVEETTKSKKNGILVSKDSVKEEPVHTSGAKKFARVNSVKVEKASKAENVKLEKTNSSSSLVSETISKSESISTVKKVEHFDSFKIEKSSSGNSSKVEKEITKEVTSDVRKPRATVRPIGSTAPPKMSSVILCKDPLRDKVRELLSEALLKVSGEVGEELREEADASDPYRVAVSLESAMYEKWGKSNGAQKFKYRSIMFNIKDSQNPDFRRKILLGHVKPDQVLLMTPEEMASDERQRQNKEIKDKALFDCERGGARQASTDQFKCGRCKKNECTYYQMQTRSADEPMTTYVTCVNCDNRWKFC
ncbi:hypothetical protein ACET3Z_023961 [Daucus carota]